jgi:hypothetical protein
MLSTAAAAAAKQEHCQLSWCGTQKQYSGEARSAALLEMKVPATQQQQ